MGAGAADGLMAEDLAPGERLNMLVTQLPFVMYQGGDGTALVERIERQATEAGGSRVAEMQVAEAHGIAAFADGRYAEAAGLYRTMASLSALNAPYMLPRAARCHLWAGDGTAAQADLDALEATGLHGPASLASRLTIRAGLAALDGRVAEASSLFRDARRAWHDLGLPWDEALTGMDMVLLLGADEPEAHAAGEAARGLLAELGALPLVARLDVALAAHSPAVMVSHERPRD